MLNIAKHKLILVQMLKEIYSDTEISSSLGFKGGTALHLFYNLPRFSADLDFNLLDVNKKEIVYEKINKILAQFGPLKDKNIKRFTLFFLLSYEGRERNIKVEISLRKFPDSYELKDYLGITMQVMKKEDIFAHKLAALLDRGALANRELFDIWFLMKERWLVNSELLEARVGTDIKTYFGKCIDTVTKMSNTYILQGLGEVLDEKMKLWAKNNLKDDLLFLLKYYHKNPLIK